MLQDKVNRVIEICGAWGLYEPGASTAQNQLIKALSEVGELADSILKNDVEAAKDDIGDIAVCVINAARIRNSYMNFNNFVATNKRSYDQSGVLSSIGGDICLFIRCDSLDRYIFDLFDSMNDMAVLFNLTLEECLDQAISVIEKRKGKIVNGAFIKEV